MNGALFYGLKGRLISGIAGFAGVLSAAVAAAQQASLVSIFPASYNKWFTAAAVVSLFVTMFSERIQGGASNPQVRIAAQQSDNENELEQLNK
jgi:NhaP-type Na+/H+ or K+/H+ antiporter